MSKYIDAKEINLFWNELNKIVKKKFILDEKIVIDKYVNLLKNSIDEVSSINEKWIRVTISDVDRNYKIWFEDSI